VSKSPQIAPDSKRYKQHIAALIDRSKAGDEFAATSLWCLQLLDAAYKLEVLAVESINARRSR